MSRKQGGKPVILEGYHFNEEYLKYLEQILVTFPIKFKIFFIGYLSLSQNYIQLDRTCKIDIDISSQKDLNFY